MAWTLTPDVGEYLGTAGGYLRARAAENTVILTATETLRARGNGAFGGPAPLFGWWREPGAPVTAAFMHTPPYGLALTAMTTDAAADLARTLAARARPLRGVNGPVAAADAFAEVWERLMHRTARTAMRSRQYRLGRLRSPDPVPPGRSRVAGPQDRGLLVSWLHAFHEEATPGDPPVAEQAADDRLSYGGLTLWETGDGPVSLAGLTRPVAGQVRVGPVYTPPRWRGRGFGGAVTAAVSRAALAAGSAEVLLFTDLANPTSNALYQRLGFQPVADRVLLLFGEPES